jgi:hypothetical protein
MKKLITSASIVALGAASVHAAYAPGLTQTERSKFWSVSASLRGFYDDNYNTQPSGPDKQDSTGLEVSPSVGFNFPMEQTLLSFNYIYGMRYYANKSEDSTDNTHQFDGQFKHAFNPDYNIGVNEAFVIGQEPGLMNPKGFLVQKLRVPGNNIYNAGSISFDGKFSRQFGFLIGYDNQYYNYDGPKDTAGIDQYSVTLDRIEHMATANLRYQAWEQTWALFGYQFGVMDMTGIDEQVGGGLDDPRNNMSHYFYLGADQTFNPNLNASVRLGVQYSTFQDAPSGASSDHWSPYADLKLSYTYTTGSSIQVGLKNSSIVSDLASLNQDAFTAYVGLNHQITAKLRGSIIGQYQHSSYNQLNYDGTKEDYFLAGVNLNYQINRYLNAEVGYNFDDLVSDMSVDSASVRGRDYTRNRVYLGIRASY